MSFAKLKERLEQEGWYVGWNHYCCQSCGWMDVPSYLNARYDEDGYVVHPETGEEVDYKTRNELYQEVDLNKVLFNHSQDCEYDWHESVYQFFGEDDEKCEEFMEEYEDAETQEDKKWVCAKYGALELYEGIPEGMLYEGSFICYPPEQQTSSLFCFAGDKEGVDNLKEILPIIEECGCTYHWDGTGKTRIEISW
jgi:hypothetical protein